MIQPTIIEHDGIFVVRDDYLPGGTKSRVLPRFLVDADEFVYATPAYGYAQVALAITAKNMKKRATIFVAKRNELHPRTRAAYGFGAKIVQIPYGYLSNVQAKAKLYCKMTGAKLIPFGLDFPEFIRAMADVAIGLNIKPAEVWTVAGSGVLTRALQIAWPQSSFHAIQIGAHPKAGIATIHKAPEKFEQDAAIKPPFPSCSNYDAKAWRFIKKYAKPGALFWNVAA